MDVTILICTRNRADDLRLTLAACEALRVGPEIQAELLVVDNGSSDQTPELLAEGGDFPLPRRLVREGRVGKSHALNRGVAEARGRVVLFADDDIRPPQEWVALMTTPILSGAAEVVGGGVRLAAAREQPWMQEVHRNWLGTNLTAEGTGLTCIAGANMAIARDLVLRLGGFDTELGPGPEGLGNAEDTLLLYQAQAAGARMVHIPQAVVEHWVQPEKAGRQAFLAAARARGRSDAFIAHHWAHRRISHLGVQRWRSRLRLAWESWSSRSTAFATPNEIWLTKQASFYEQFLAESTRRPKYPRADESGHSHP